MQTGEEHGSQSEDVAARRKFLSENSELLYQYGTNLLPLLLQVYHGTVVQQVHCPTRLQGFPPNP